MKICYIPTRIQKRRRAVLEQANTIIAQYAAQGYSLTLRQLFYQFVSRNLIPNTQREYNRLGDAVNTGRLAGVIDWDSIEDRTRNLRSVGAWAGPSEIVRAAAETYRREKWSTQPWHVEAWVEKDALIGVLEQVCERWEIPCFSCRGYVSQSELWGASQRFGSQLAIGKRVLLLHLGDHDPSGIDMTRDIEARLALFLDQDRKTGRIRFAGDLDDALEVRRLALNMAQVERYRPPPNPAKLKDTRAATYIEQFGRQSWELDALEPDVIAALIHR